MDHDVAGMLEFACDGEVGRVGVLPTGFVVRCPRTAVVGRARAIAMQGVVPTPRFCATSIRRKRSAMTFPGTLRSAGGFTASARCRDRVTRQPSRKTFFSSWRILHVGSMVVSVFVTPLPSSIGS